MTKQEILEAMQASYEEWLAAQLDAAAHRQLPTAKDCFGQNEAPPPDINIANNQQRNEWNYERYRNWPLEAVEQEAEFAFGWLTRKVEELPESAFDSSYTIADYDNINHVRPATEGDDFRFPLWRLLYNGTAEHYPAHVEDLQVWLARSSQT